MRALAVLGLGLAHDKGATAEIAAIARGVDSGNVARAAAAYALGELGADGEAATLLSLAQGTDPLPRQMALVALARMGVGRAEPPGGRAALAAMADAVFSGGDVESARARAASESLQRAAAASLTLLAVGATSSSTVKGAKAETRATRDVLPVPEGNVDVEAMLESLVPRGMSDKDRAAAFVKYSDALQRAALGALQTSGDRARSVLDALGTGEGAFEPFVGKDATPGTEAAHARARDVTRRSSRASFRSCAIPIRRFAPRPSCSSHTR